MTAARVARLGVTIALFAVGLSVGVMAYGSTQSKIEYGPYPPLPEAAEPLIADELTDLIVDGQDQLIARRFGTDLLSQLAEAFEFGSPQLGFDRIVDVTDMRYLGSVSDGRQQLALYNIHGVTRSGTPVVTGISLRIDDGQITGVNQ